MYILRLLVSSHSNTTINVTRKSDHMLATVNPISTNGIVFAYSVTRAWTCICFYFSTLRFSIIAPIFSASKLISSFALISKLLLPKISFSIFFLRFSEALLSWSGAMAIVVGSFPPLSSSLTAASTIVSTAGGVEGSVSQSPCESTADGALAEWAPFSSS